jgi:Toprim-like
VYADPPTHPTVVNVRYIPEEQLPKGTRTFKPEKNHKMWGNRIQPLGSWRIRPTTHTIIVVEGLFDMLITAQKIHELGRDADTLAVYTNGSSPSAKVLQWFTEHKQYDYLLIRDPDDAGKEWSKTVSAAILYGGAKVRKLRTPNKLALAVCVQDGWSLASGVVEQSLSPTFCPRLHLEL